MSILTNATFISPGNPFYGSSAGGAGGPVVATSLLVQPATPGNAVITISNNDGNTTSSIAVDGTSDNLSVNPGTGDLILGNATATVSVLGATGTGQVYDSVNNRPQPGADFTLATFSPNMTQTSYAYTVAKSGWYVFSTYLNFQGAGFSWPATTVITLRLQANAAEVQFSQATWWAMPDPPPSGVEDNRDCLVQLSAGDVLTVQLSTYPSPPALGATGTVICNIQPILA
jgi:hypothetical protein